MKKFFILAILSAFVFACCPSCSEFSQGFNEQNVQSSSGVKKATADVKVQASGLTVEQENVKMKLERENMPGAVKHLYVISAMSGQVIIYSTVDGKVTSSGKRLTPKTVAAAENQYTSSDMEGIPIKIGNRVHNTSEVLGDDGTYGSSIPYLYWIDTKGIYHQHYVSGGQIVHISDEPLAVKSIMINVTGVGSEN